MKRIGIDARLYFQTGVGVYLRNLIHYLGEIDDKNLEYIIYVMEGDKEKIKISNPPLGFSIKEVPYRWHSFSEQIYFWKDLEKDNLDLMHFTYFSFPVLYRRKFIATVHDLTPLLYRTGKASTQNPIFYWIKQTLFRYVLYTQIKNALHIITPTNTIKKQIINWYGQLYASKTSSIYEGIDYEISSIKENKSLSKKFQEPFFIYVGNFYPHKNIEKLIDAYTRIDKNIKLILIGPEDFFTDRIRSLVKNLSLEDKVLFYNKCSREDLVYFYKHATALIHPTLSEGFGLPIVEAAYFNVSILGSNIEVFQELLGNSYISFDPTNAESIAKAIVSFLKKPQKYNYDKVLGKFSFEEMTKQTLKLYHMYA